MRLKYSYEKMELNGRIFAIPVGDEADDCHGAVKMNGTAAAIFELLKKDTTEEAIVEAMEKEYDVAREVLSADVKRYIQAFREKGLLAE